MAKAAHKEIVQFRRSEARPEAASFSNWSPAGGPYVYSTQTGHLPEAPTCIQPEMYQARSLFTMYGRAKQADNGVLDTPFQQWSFIHLCEYCKYSVFLLAKAKS